MSTPETFCDQYAITCFEDNTDWADRSTCIAAVKVFTPGFTGDKKGNTAACRAYHLNAAMVDPKTHCGHAGLSGGGVCVGDKPELTYVTPPIHDELLSSV